MKALAVSKDMPRQAAANLVEEKMEWTGEIKVSVGLGKQR
jgi:hypothetical protein